MNATCRHLMAFEKNTERVLVVLIPKWSVIVDYNTT